MAIIKLLKGRNYMLLEEADIKALKLFNEKAELLSHRKFFNYESTRTIIQWKKGVGFDNRIEGPTDEEMEAIILTIRFFCQDNEPCSLRKLQNIYDKLKDIEDYSKRFSEARKYFNELLNSEPPMKHIISGRNIINEEIFDIFLNGLLAHSNKKEKHDIWKGIPPEYILLKTEFLSIVYQFYGVIIFIKKLNIEVLEKLTPPTSVCGKHATI